MPRELSRDKIIEWLRRAAEHAQHAEAYHEAAANPRSIEGPAAQQAANDAAAMQLIELAGRGEGFTIGRGDLGTTLARLDDALTPFYEARTAHAHPEFELPRSPVTPRYLAAMTVRLKSAIGNLDPETQRILPPAEWHTLRGFAGGLEQLEKDRLPDPAALRTRDLHYAGFYHEIQFGRLAKATGLFSNFGKTQDPRLVDIHASIYDVDDMAHRFHEMRRGADMSVLPVSVVSPRHRERVPGRSLSELMREQRFDYQTPPEHVAEVQAAMIADALARRRDAVRELARTYAEITGDPGAAAPVRDYLQRKEPLLQSEEIVAMSAALRAAAAPDGAYLTLPEAVRDHCLGLCLELDQQGDKRLLGILDAAEERDEARERDDEPELDRDDDELDRGRKR